MNWQPHKLGEFISIKHGWAFKGEYFSDSGKYILLTPGNAHETGGLKLRPGKEKYYLGEFPPDYLMKTGDMLVVMTDLIQAAPILGGAIVVPEDDRFLHNQRLGLVELLPHAEIDKGFLYYLLNSPGYRSQVRGSATGATVRHTAPKRICDCNVLVPDTVEEQQQVAFVLSAYDDLIATNQRRIALLEDAARRLYREWFVHLRFPGHESVPVKDGVPEGWRKTPIAEQTSFLNRGIAPKYDDAAKGRVINQKCIRDGRISMEPARRQSKDVKPDRLVQMGDVLINSTGAGTLGRVAQVRAPIDDCTVDTHVTIARPIDEGSWTYFGQALLNLEPVFSEMGKGATNQLELSRSDIGAVEIWLPPQHLHAEFERLVGPMLVQAEQLSVANLSLEKARDLLLPKLMSGQLDVSGIALPDEVAA